VATAAASEIDRRRLVGGLARERERWSAEHPRSRERSLTPFHNMALTCPATTDAQVDRHTAVFREAVVGLV
jgi:hypothetical protein